MTGWQPIDSAPKAGLRPPRIDLWVHEPHHGGYRVPDAFWHDERWMTEILFGFKIRAFPAGHTALNWMTQPDPPDDYAMPARSPR